jgi:hypothetical protein
MLAAQIKKLNISRQLINLGLKYQINIELFNIFASGHLLLQLAIYEKIMVNDVYFMLCKQFTSTG